MENKNNGKILFISGLNNEDRKKMFREKMNEENEIV